MPIPGQRPLAGNSLAPVRDKDHLVDELRALLQENAGFCEALGASLSALEHAETPLARLNRLSEVKAALIAPDDVRKTFMAQALLADRVYAALKPHRFAYEFAIRMETLGAMVDEIRLELNPAKGDITDVLRRIGEVLDRSIGGTEMVKGGPAPMDLSKIDFKALAAKFKKSTTKTLDIERMKAVIRAQLDRLIAANPTRVDLREKFEALIEAYNAGSAQIEQLFQELLKLSQSLSEEETRHVREQLSEDELCVFDLLTRPGPDLSATEREAVKKAAKDLLARLKSILTMDWQKTAQSRAKVQLAIEEALDEGLPRAYTPDIYKSKTSIVFQHVIERYALAA